MPGLHAAADTAAFADDPDNDLDELTDFSCPGCGSLEWREKTYGRIYEWKIFRLNENGTLASEDWDTIDQETDDTDPWECRRCGYIASDELSDHLNEIY